MIAGCFFYDSRVVFICFFMIAGWFLCVFIKAKFLKICLPKAAADPSRGTFKMKSRGCQDATDAMMP